MNKPQIEKPGIITKNKSIIDHVATGDEAKNYRIRQGIRQAHVARMMGLPPPNLCLLEAGRLNWNEALLADYCHAVETLVKNKS